MDMKNILRHLTKSSFKTAERTEDKNENKADVCVFG